VANAAPDGYQVLFGGSGNLVFNQVLYRKPLFNSLTDFTPVALLTEQSLVLIARKDLPADDLQSFMRHVRANRTASFGSSGVGSSTHLGCVLLNLSIGVEPTHVPYRGNVAAMQDLMGGRIDYFCDIIVTAVPHVQAGTVKAIAILSSRRSPLLPDLRTADEQGLARLDTANWYGLFLPKGTPASIVEKLHDTAAAALDTPSFRDRLHGPRSSSPSGAARSISPAFSRTTSRNGPPRSRRAASRWTEPGGATDRPPGSGPSFFRAHPLVFRQNDHRVHALSLRMARGSVSR